KDPIDMHVESLGLIGEKMMVFGG
ncbi:MAG: hypothetical protein RLZ22_1134, partial [Verrucomicrobiota bacterium]